MKQLMIMALAAIGLAGCLGTGKNEGVVALVSPDGHNEIRLYANEKPLSYEVARDGVIVVAKSKIGMKVNGACLAKDAPAPKVSAVKDCKGSEKEAVYKKAALSLTGREQFVDFGTWGVHLVARNDGVAYRFVTSMASKITVDGECAELTIPDPNAKCWVNMTGQFGCQETIPESLKASELKTDGTVGVRHAKSMIYLPFDYEVGGKFVAVTESDVRNYPILNFKATGSVEEGAVHLKSLFAGAPKVTRHDGNEVARTTNKGGRWVRVLEHEDYLVKTAGKRTFPWRTFILADKPSKFCEADIVNALAPAPKKDMDFSWVKPGKVAWDWWNCFDNAPKSAPNGGCTTKTYERFIDFAAKTGVEYVIFDEGWSESLNIWKFHPEVDVPHLIDYANKKGVGIILWMAWAQVYGEEEKVAAHFSKLGAKGFKVDFMDRGDAEMARFLEKLAKACAKHHLLLDYHGAYLPTGLQRRYPNVLNYEGIHGLETLKWFQGGEQAEREMMFNDVAEFYLRMSAGPMDYTPGAMLNTAVGAGYKSIRSPTPGSVGTRCRQMAMMALYEAPLQMLCDSPTNYEKNMESFSFMAATPVVWKKTVGLPGCPDSVAAVARQARDGAWYAAAITTIEARDYTLDTSFLGKGKWKAEIFRDAPDSDKIGTHYVHEKKTVAAGEKMAIHMAPGGGFVIRFSK